MFCTFSANEIDGYVGVEVTSFTSGSTVAHFRVIFESVMKFETQTETATVVQVIQTAVETGKLERLAVKKSVPISAEGVSYKWLLM